MQNEEETLSPSQILERFAVTAAERQSNADAPRIDDLVMIALTPDRLEELAGWGITVRGEAFGSGNVILFDRQQPKMTLELVIRDASGSTIILGRSGETDNCIRILGERNTVCFSGIGGQQGKNRLQMNVVGNDNLVHVGTDCTFVSTDFIFSGDEGRLFIGPDCMFSWGIMVHNYSHHVLVDVGTGAVINRPTDMLIGRHVWVGQDVFFTRGVEIGDGSVLGARSLVTDNIPGNVVVAGTPARVIRENASWSRERFRDNRRTETYRRDC